VCSSDLPRAITPPPPQQRESIHNMYFDSPSKFNPLQSDESVSNYLLGLSRPMANKDSNESTYTNLLLPWDNASLGSTFFEDELNTFKQTANFIPFQSDSGDGKKRKDGGDGGGGSDTSPRKRLKKL